ncbi:MarR family winged helix-turn-helix transcriptional regulator [Bdellovibrio bacteriovorus]|uniref:MarR family winged helix-turn-helix transcriptional regulator n=1 Tax=Bdellovibrio bacteriovorus TaxID=959 RepID=UPI003D04FAA4
MKIEAFLSQSPSFQTVITGNLIFSAVSSDLKDLNLGMFEALTLSALFFEKDRTARPMDLKDAFGIPKANISHIIRSLEKKKLLKRSSAANDARGYEITLTNKGEQLCPQIISYFDKLQRRLEKDLGEKELDMFLAVMQDLATLHPRKVRT